METASKLPQWVTMYLCVTQRTRTLPCNLVLTLGLTSLTVSTDNFLRYHCALRVRWAHFRPASRPAIAATPSSTPCLNISFGRVNDLSGKSVIFTGSATGTLFATISLY
jgi:hypothetical protein